LLALPASAQVMGVSGVVPNHPTTADKIILVMDHCDHILVGVRVDGQTIEIQTVAGNGVCIAAPSPMTVPIGHLPPGQYSAHIRFTDETRVLIGPPFSFEVTVAPQQVPTTGRFALIAMGILFAAIGSIILKSR
jgi:hypothetical protein